MESGKKSKKKFSRVLCHCPFNQYEGLFLRIILPFRGFYFQGDYTVVVGGLRGKSREKKIGISQNI